MSATQEEPVPSEGVDVDVNTNASITSAPLAPLGERPPTPPPDDDDADDTEMAAAASKELPTAEKSPTDGQTVARPSVASDSISSILYTVCKKVAIVGSIYMVGYMGWSVAWLIAPVILSVARDQFRKTTEHKRNIAKTSALACEKDVILARIDELPAWVYFPDVERCEWVNKILKQVWPNANHFARTLVKETIEPNVELALANYKLNGFRFDRIILGTIPPRIGGVKVYDKNVDRNEIIMDLDLFYASDCDINFYLRGMKGGIKDFQIHGWVRVVMKPLIRSMPLVGGLQIFFLNNPNIDFNLVGVIDFMDMPGLSDLLRRIIVEQIGAVMVLPNKLPITLSEEVPATSLKMPEPEGVLRIHVVEAKNLMKKDISVLGKGKSDPYVVINVGAQEFKTKIIENNVNPKWDHWCEARIFENGILDFEISFNIWDSDLPGSNSDDFLGRATVEIANVLKKGLVDTWLTLEDAKHGLLHVRLQWYKLTADAADLQAALQETQLLRVATLSTALLTVFIDSAKNLKQARTSSKPDPYLVCSVGKQKEQTAMIMRDDSPVWEQGFTFLVANPENDTLQMKIFDQKTGSEIGQFTYVISGLLNKKNMAIDSQPYQLHKSGPESKVHMSLSLRIIRPGDIQEDPNELSESVATLTRSSSVKTPTQDGAVAARELQTQSSRISVESPIIEEETPMKVANSNSMANVTPPRSPKPFAAALQAGDNVLTHRFPDNVSMSGEHGLGKIQLAVRYSVQRQRLTVTVKKIMNIPLRDPSNIPDPYVKLYLLPGRTKESKRKTLVVKDNCNPVFDATFEYLISTAELIQTELEVTVSTQKGFMYGTSPTIGMLKIPLNDPEISGNGLNSWFDLQPEMKHE